MIFPEWEYALRTGEEKLRFNACPPQVWVAQLDLFALRLGPCALGHSCFIIRDADKALHLVLHQMLTELT